MGYRDDFYIAENIIGYTGKLQENPSVYFFIGGASKTFGHITQDHGVPENIGRGKVKTDPDYKYGNIRSKGKRFFYERWSDGRHPSRHLLILRDDFKEHDLAILCNAIIDHTEQKKYDQLSVVDKEGAKRSGADTPSVSEVIKAYEKAAAASKK
jgi:hypothetical protein